MIGLWQKNRKTRLKQPLALFAAAALVAGMTATPARALSPGIADTGPGGGVWSVMQRHSDATRVGARAMSRLVKQSDSTLALVCFDRSLMLSSRLGAIFSDVPPTNLMPPNKTVFNNGDLYNIHAGVGLNNNGEPNMLANAYGALGNTLDSYLGNMGGMALPGPYDKPRGGESAPSNFGGSITDGMGATQVTSIPTYLSTLEMYLTNPGVGLYPDNMLVDVNLLMADLDPDPVNQIENLFDYNRTGTMAEHLLTMIGVMNTSLDAVQDMSDSYFRSTNVLATGVPDYYGAMAAVMQNRHDIYDAYNCPSGKGPSSDPICTINSQVDNGYYHYSGSKAGDPGPTFPEIFTAAFLNMATGVLGWKDASLTGYSWTDLQTTLAAGDMPDPDKGGCNYMKFLFGGIPGNKLGVEGLTGDGPYRYMPYYSYADLTEGAVAGAGPEMEEELGGDNAALLGTAKDDLVNIMRAPGVPGGLSSWSKPPALPPISAASAALPGSPGSPASIVSLMP
jgi:hypothetical protein